MAPQYVIVKYAGAVNYAVVDCLHHSKTLSGQQPKDTTEHGVAGRPRQLAQDPGCSHPVEHVSSPPYEQRQHQKDRQKDFEQVKRYREEKKHTAAGGCDPTRKNVVAQNCEQRCRHRQHNSHLFTDDLGEWRDHPRFRLRRWINRLRRGIARFQPP